MTIKLGINGFGRIGRAILRLSLEDSEVQVVQINDLSPPDTLAHLLKYDSVHGILPQDVEVTENYLMLGGQRILCSTGSEPNRIHWGESETEIVLECTGKFRDRVHAEQHLANGVKKVVVSAPGKDIDATIVMGVNEKDYQSSYKTVSNASCTTNCLAPVVKVIDDHLKVLRGYMTTVHSYTNDQRILCGAHRDLRRARAGALNQIPTTTGAARAIGLVMPHLKGKLEGMSIRVPTPNVSLVDVVLEVQKDTTSEIINQMFEKVSKNELKGILDYTELPLVSSDYNGSRFSAVVDGLSTNVLEGNLVKVLAWYDNETGFSQRMIDLAKYIAKH